jgi:hypothetical protein
MTALTFSTEKELKYDVVKSTPTHGSIIIYPLLFDRMYILDCKGPNGNIVIIR